MVAAKRRLAHTPADDLRAVIEPLAGFICASDRPKAVLNQVYAALFNEIAQVNRVAAAYVSRVGRPACR